MLKSETNKKQISSDNKIKRTTHTIVGIGISIVLILISILLFDGFTFCGA